MYSVKRVNTFIYLALSMIALASLLSVPCDGQVTFSRDWNAGKRSLESPECRSNIKSTTAICNLFVNEIRQLARCEVRAENDNANSPN